MATANSNTVTAVHRIKEEIDKLIEAQTDAIKRATYLGMTPDEATEYNERRGRITQLIQELESLTKAQ